MNAKSKRIKEMNTGDYTLHSFIGDRLAKVFKQEDYETSDEIIVTYIFEASSEFMPADYRAEFDTLEELLDEMRNFNSDGRKWQFFTYS